MTARTLLLATAALGLSACTFKYTPIASTVEVGTTDFSNIDSYKEGKACQTLLFGALPIGGQATVTDAIKDGKLKTVRLVDQEITNYYLFAKRCVIVLGE